MTPNAENPENPEIDPPEEIPEEIDERLLAIIDAALKVQTPLAHKYVEGLRAKHPEASQRQLLEMVTGRFTTLMTAAGAGVGGVAALPGVGTAVALGLTIGEGVSFAEACAFLTLSAADIYDVDMSDKHTRRLVMMAVLSGERGHRIVARAMGKQGLQWNAVLGGSGGGFLPGLVSRQVSKYIRRRIVSRAGSLWLGRLLPFGLGALVGGIGARAVSRSVVESLMEIFSQAPTIEGELGEDRSQLGS